MLSGPSKETILSVGSPSSRSGVQEWPDGGQALALALRQGPRRIRRLLVRLKRVAWREDVAVVGEGRARFLAEKNLLLCFLFHDGCTVYSQKNHGTPSFLSKQETGSPPSIVRIFQGPRSVAAICVSQ